jgi:hypothetical protein
MPSAFPKSNGRRIALALMLAAPVAHGQRQTMVPVALANALWGGFASETGMVPRFTVGRAPADFPRALIPGAPWTVVGGVEFGPLRATLFEGPGSRDLATEYSALVTRSGYRRIVFGDETGGFMDRQRPSMYCADSTLVSIMPGDSTATTRTLLVHWVPSSQGCADGRTEGRHAPLEIPTLRAPTGTRAFRRGSAWGEDYVEQNAQLDTTMSVAATIEHYTRQLVAAGWTVVGRPLLDAGTGMQRLAMRDEKGTQWNGILAVITAGEQRDLSLRMAKPRTASPRSP